MLKIRTDYRIELVSLIGFLSNLEGKYTIDRTETDYTQELIKRFSEHSNHPAVTNFSEMWDNGLCWDAIPFLLLHLDDNFQVKENTMFPERLKARYDNDFQEVIDYLDQIKDFAQISAFRTFYDSYNSNQLLEEANHILSQYNMIYILENYLQVKFDKASVLMTNLFTSSFGVSIVNNNEKEVFAVIGGGSLRMAQRNNAMERIVLSVVWHEFMHSIINPLSDKLFANPFQMSDEEVDCYCALNESIIWALTFRLLYKHGIVTEQDESWYFNNARNNRAPKTEELYRLLPIYEQNKSINIVDFYPQLKDEFFGEPSCN
jgi:uncharacterized protein YozE (UPF0346 family)